MLKTAYLFFLYRKTHLVFVFSLSLIVLFSLFQTLSTAYADSFPQQPVITNPSPTQAPSRGFFNFDSNVPLNVSTLMQGTVLGAFPFLTCTLIGKDLTDAKQKCLGINLKTGAVAYTTTNKGGMVGYMTQLIAITYTPIIGTGDYLAYLDKSFIVKHAYAASIGGAGFDSISPILPLWAAFRNIAYLLYVLVFIFIGIGIMLRLKISPQVVMGIENQLPKVIIALILTTFSFAIAGFLIDLMWVATYVVINIMIYAAPANTFDANILFQSLGATPFTFYDNLYHTSTGGWGIVARTADSAFALRNLVSSLVNSILINNLVGTIIALVFDFAVWPLSLISIAGCFWDNFHIVGGFSQNPFSDCVVGVASDVVGNVALVIGFIVIFVVLMKALFQLWIILLKAYIMVLLNVIFAPFYILMGVIPGSSTGFGSWFRATVAELSTFTVSVAALMLSVIFAKSFQATAFTPPLTGSEEPTFSNNPLSAILALGILLAAPKLANAVKEALKVKEGKLSSGLGLAAGTAALGSMVSYGGQQLAKNFTNTKGNAITGALTRLWTLGRRG